MPILFALIPLPVFIDLSSFSIIDLDYDGSGVPVPIGLFAFVIICLLRLKSIVNHRLIVLAVFIFAIALMMSLFGRNFTHVIQSILPIFLFALLLHVKMDNREIEFSVCGFVFFLILYLLYQLPEILNGSQINFLEFGPFFLYQGFVSFVAVLSLYAIILISRSSGLFQSVSFALIVLVGLLSQRKVFLIDICLILAIAFFSRRKPILLISLTASLMAFDFLYELGFFKRLIEASANSDFSSGRNEIYITFIDNLNIADYEFWFGRFIDFVPANHNLLMDVFDRNGFLFFVFFLGCIVFLLREYLSKFRSYVYVAMLFSVLFTSTFLNSNLTQPYFAVNFVLTMIYFRNRDELV